MSQFLPVTVVCPGCSTPVVFDLVQSVNADRMPALRDAILARSFQSQRCPTCCTEFRVPPEFNYVEHGRDLWISAWPLERLPHWREAEAEAEARFERFYGAGASPFIRDLGTRLKRRLAFGWAAVREKLVVADLGLDDLTVEVCKAAAIGATASAPLGQGAELRLLGGDDRRLVFAWLRATDERLLQPLEVERSLYDEIAADAGIDGPGDWAPLRASLDGMFVDLGRTLVASEPLPVDA